MIDDVIDEMEEREEVADQGTMHYPEGTHEQASGPEAVGKLASKFLHKVSEQ